MLDQPHPRPPNASWSGRFAQMWAQMRTGHPWEWKKKLFQIRAFCLGRLIKQLMQLLVYTCRIRMEGAALFCQTAATKKCMLLLWHNRLAIVPMLLRRYAPSVNFAALISASRDGDILSTIVHSYRQGRTIRVAHHTRHEALRQLIREVAGQQSVVIVTPDGPRGPRYALKPGVALAALETGAELFALNWEVDKYWELKTWDKLRIPKPFSTIRASFSKPLRLEKALGHSMETAKTLIKQHLPTEAHRP